MGVVLAYVHERELVIVHLDSEIALARAMSLIPYFYITPLHVNLIESVYLGPMSFGRGRSRFSLKQGDSSNVGLAEGETTTFVSPWLKLWSKLISGVSFGSWANQPSRFQGLGGTIKL
jgi:hypothetical protein